MRRAGQRKMDNADLHRQRLLEKEVCHLRAELLESKRYTQILEKKLHKTEAQHVAAICARKLLANKTAGLENCTTRLKRANELLLAKFSGDEAKTVRNGLCLQLAELHAQLREKDQTLAHLLEERDAAVLPLGAAGNQPFKLVGSISGPKIQKEEKKREDDKGERSEDCVNCAELIVEKQLGGSVAEGKIEQICNLSSSEFLKEAMQERESMSMEATGKALKEAGNVGVCISEAEATDKGVQETQSFLQEVLGEVSVLEQQDKNIEEVMTELMKFTNVHEEEVGALKKDLERQMGEFRARLEQVESRMVLQELPPNLANENIKRSLGGRAKKRRKDVLKKRSCDGFKNGHDGCLGEKFAALGKEHMQTKVVVRRLTHEVVGCRKKEIGFVISRGCPKPSDLRPRKYLSGGYEEGIENYPHLRSGNVNRI
uniref:hyaluronan mediated motility receptor-like n=1 Tax=Myxine glutinosa TaxID=7769 RepID=UPI00358DECFC